MFPKQQHGWQRGTVWAQPQSVGCVLPEARRPSVGLPNMLYRTVCTAASGANCSSVCLEWGRGRLTDEQRPDDRTDDPTTLLILPAHSTIPKGGILARNKWPMRLVVVPAQPDLGAKGQGQASALSAHARTPTAALLACVRA